jgi:hypothetical protein
MKDCQAAIRAERRVRVPALWIRSTSWMRCSRGWIACSGHARGHAFFGGVRRPGFRWSTWRRPMTPGCPSRRAGRRAAYLGARGQATELPVHGEIRERERTGKPPSPDAQDSPVRLSRQPARRGRPDHIEADLREGGADVRCRSPRARRRCLDRRSRAADPGAPAACTFQLLRPLPEGASDERSGPLIPGVPCWVANPRTPRQPSRLRACFRNGSSITSRSRGADPVLPRPARGAPSPGSPRSLRVRSARWPGP